MLSVAGVHLRSTRFGFGAVAVSTVGAAGGVVSGMKLVFSRTSSKATSYVRPLALSPSSTRPTPVVPSDSLALERIRFPSSQTSMWLVEPLRSTWAWSSRHVPSVARVVPDVSATPDEDARERSVGRRPEAQERDGVRALAEDLETDAVVEVGVARGELGVRVHGAARAGRTRGPRPPVDLSLLHDEPVHARPLGEVSGLEVDVQQGGTRRRRPRRIARGRGVARG